MADQGIGDFVQVSGGVIVNSPGVIEGQNVLLDKYNQTYQLVEDMNTKVTDVLQELEDVIVDLTIPADWNENIQNVVITEVPGIDTNTVPAPGDFELPGFEEVIFPIAPLLKTAPDIDLTYTAPTKPAEVNPALNYTMANYSSEMWLELFTKVEQGIATEGEGFGSGVEQAIWDRARNRQVVENETAMETAIRDVGDRAVPYPAIARRSIEQRMAATVLRQNTDLNAEITTKQAELAQTNYHKMLDSALTIEQILRDFYKVQETLSLDAAKAAAQLLIENYANQLKAFIAEWEGIIKELEAKQAAIQVIVSENKVLADMYSTMSQGAIAQVEMQSKERASLVDTYKAEVSAYGTRVSAQADIYNALTENQKAQLEANSLELEKAVQELKALVDFTVAGSGARSNVLEAIGQIASQVMASALNAVNTSIGYSSNFSEGKSESIGYSASIGETKAYDMTIT